MPDKFDPYREALVMEENTVWPEEFDSIDVTERQRVEKALHADPAQCSHVEYVRMHTGFCRQVTVTEGDFERAGG